MQNLVRLSVSLFISLFTLVALGFSFNILAQSPIDENTLLLLRFNNSPNGEQGETPLQAVGLTYEAGISGQGVLVNNSDVLRYATAGNINASAGTIEFWVKPRWDGNETLNRVLFGIGNSPYSEGTLVFEKDGGGSLAVTVNTPHGFVGTNASSWGINQWRYVAYTWTFPGDIKVYVDGEEKFSRPATIEDILTSIPSTLTVGSMNTIWQANAVIDELRVSNRPRTVQEIRQRMRTALLGLTVNNIALSAVANTFWKTWRIPPKVIVNSNAGTISFPPATLNWSSSNSNVATVNRNGQIVALEAGTASLTASVNGTHQVLISMFVRRCYLPALKILNNLTAL